MIWRSIGIIVVVEIMAAIQRQPVPHHPRVAQRQGRCGYANLGLFLASIAFVYAVKTTTPANAAFLGSLTPLVAVVFVSRARRDDVALARSSPSSSDCAGW